MPQRIAYLLNMYPMTSTTFIREEIRAHEADGTAIDRFSIRPWGDTLVEKLDRDDADRTEYLLDAGAARLVLASMAELLTNPLGFARGIGGAISLARQAHAKRLHNFAYLVEAIHFKRRAWALGVTHVHAHFSTNATAVALLSHRLGGPGYSFTVHGPDELEDTDALALPLKARDARAIATISDYCKGVVIDAVGPDIADKTHIVRCGIDPDDFALRDTEIAPNNQTLVCVGRLGDQKQQLRLPDVAAALKDDFPHLRFVLIGDGHARDAIAAKAADLGVSDQIELRGWAGKAEIKAELSGARAMVLPSLAEGLPVAIMEALALGCPVVTTKITGIPELVDAECGWLVPSLDTPALIEAVRACLLTPPDRIADMGRIGRDRVIARHDVRKTAADLRAVISTLPGGFDG